MPLENAQVGPEDARVYGIERSPELGYVRQGGRVAVTVSGFSNHELRAVIVGLWSMLDAEDRVDAVRELAHYQENGPGTYLPPVALAFCQSQHGPSSDLCPRKEA